MNKVKSKKKHFLQREGNDRYYDRILSKSREGQQKNFYKNSSGQLYELLFLANTSEHSWQSSPLISSTLSSLKLKIVLTYSFYAGCTTKKGDTY